MGESDDGFFVGVTVGVVGTFIVGGFLAFIKCATYAGERHSEGHRWGYEQGFKKVCEERGWVTARVDGEWVCAPKEVLEALKVRVPAEAE